LGSYWVGKLQTTPLTAPSATNSRFGFETSLSTAERCFTPTIVSKYPKIATTSADEIRGGHLNEGESTNSLEMGHFTVNAPDWTWPRISTPALSHSKYHVSPACQYIKERVLWGWGEGDKRRRQRRRGCQELVRPNSFYNGFE
jgi:hypothetical protein